jgi:hypothetical protein
MSLMPRFLCAVLASLALVTLILVPTADARPTLKKAIWGPIEVGGQSQFPVYRELGVSIFQKQLSWNRVAIRRPADPRNPNDPAYSWPTDVDRAISEGGRYGIGISLAVIGTPAWANGGQDFRWAPNRPRDYSDFMAAAAARYPAVRHWMVWIEPTKSQNFQPLSPDRGRRLRGRGLRGARLYSQMLDASYAALKRANRRNKIIGGNTFTTGTVSPRRWMQALRLPNGRRPRMDLYGHNPFTVRRPSGVHPPLGRGWADIYDLPSLSGWIDRYLGRHKLRIFISEFALPTDRENWQFNFFLTRAAQARWMAAALRICRRDRRVYSFGYLGLYDEARRTDDRQVRWGLIDDTGMRKPAFDAFRGG